MVGLRLARSSRLSRLSGRHFKTLFAPDYIVLLVPQHGLVSRHQFDSQERSGMRACGGATGLPKEFSFDGKTITIIDWIETSGTTGLVVMADNKLAFEQYYQGNTANRRRYPGR